MFYKIIFELETPISFIERPIFDSILAYCYMRDTQGIIEQKLDIQKEDLIDFFEVLPLCSSKNEGFQYFNASWMLYEEANVLEGQDSYKKRFDFYNDSVVDFDGKVEKILINKGDFKSYDVPISLNIIKQCWFYFESENVTEVERLIRLYLFGIGKKTAYGYGKIKKFHVEHCDFNPFEQVIRPIPYRERKEGFAYLSYKPPYWLSSNFTYCKIK